MSSKAAVKVAVRIRPPNESECARGDSHIIVNPTLTSVSINSQGNSNNNTESNDSKTFAFDRVFSSLPDTPNYASQQTVYDELGADILDTSFKGYNACLLCYGQSGSGKTYSFLGNNESEDQLGIVPRLCSDMFARIDHELKNRSGEIKAFKVEISFMELYNEKVRDLFENISMDGGNSSNSSNSSSKRKPPTSYRVREHPIHGPYVENLQSFVVENEQDMLRLMAQGSERRAVGQTGLNDVSSRSHAIFLINLIQTRYDPDIGDFEVTSRICLVDLAGSERIKKSQAVGDRLKEGTSINQSLTTLGLVIKALVERSQQRGEDESVPLTPRKKEKREVFIPYRSSVLTWLLKECLGGNSFTIMLATISPSSLHYEETLSTLRYAQRAKSIVNVATVNEDPNAKLIRDLKAEVTRLRTLLSSQNLDEVLQLPQELSQPSPLPSASSAISFVEKEKEITLLRDRLRESELLMQDLRAKYESRKQLQEAENTEPMVMPYESDDPSSRRNSIDGRRQQPTPALRIEDQQYPHFVNLNDSTLYDHIVLFFLREGQTKIGSHAENDMVLEGPFIHPFHAIVETEEDETLSVWIQPCFLEGIGFSTTNDDGIERMPKIFVNGVLITERWKLKHGDRLIFGHYHVFRFNHPKEAVEMRKTRKLSTSNNGYMPTTTSVPSLQPSFQTSTDSFGVIADRPSYDHDRKMTHPLSMMSLNSSNPELSPRPSDSSSVPSLTRPPVPDDEFVEFSQSASISEASSIPSSPIASRPPSTLPKESESASQPSPNTTAIQSLQSRIEQLELALQESERTKTRIATETEAKYLESIRQLSEQIILKQQEEEDAIELARSKEAQRASPIRESDVNNADDDDDLPTPFAVVAPPLRVHERASTGRQSVSKESVNSDTTSGGLLQVIPDYLDARRASHSDAQLWSRVFLEDSVLAKYVHVTIPRAELIQPPNEAASFHVYLIRIHIALPNTLNHETWVIGRRYKEFQRFQQQFASSLPPGLASLFPTQKLYFSVSSKSPQVVEYRRQQFEQWLQGLIVWIARSSRNSVLAKDILSNSSGSRNESPRPQLMALPPRPGSSTSSRSGRSSSFSGASYAFQRAGRNSIIAGPNNGNPDHEVRKGIEMELPFLKPLNRDRWMWDCVQGIQDLLDE